MKKMLYRLLHKLRFHWAIHKMTHRKSVQQRVLAEFHQLYPEARFVQIGANDGMLADPVHRFIKKSRWTGVLVEPQPDVFEQLQKNYLGRDGLQFECAAITNEDGVVKLYRPAEGQRGKGEDALASLDAGPLSHMLGQAPETIEVPSLRFDTLLRRYALEGLELLVTDTEGADLAILSGIDFSKIKPLVIIYEHIYIAERERHGLREQLIAYGYDCAEEGLDTICVLQPTEGAETRLAKLHGAFLRLKNSTQPQSDPWPKAETGGLLKQWLRLIHNVAAELSGFRLMRQKRWHQTFGTTNYRAQTPLLSPEAMASLQPANPRLLELQEQYAQVKEAVTRHSLWAGSYTLSSMSMRFFRGQSAYVWMYGELPRAMRMKYYLFAQYAQAQSPGLFSRLSEDGAFGAISYDFEQFGLVSRDRVDSALEIDFLNRHVNILDKPGLRVLDIGAGYGRLAHRMTQVCTGLVDYCCVDSVAESTFFCEFYIAYRKLNEKIRILPLPEVVCAGTELGRFDVAINVHSFSECTYEAIEWWLQRVAALNIPYLFIVPNDPVSFLSTEIDGTKRDYSLLIKQAGYRIKASEPLFNDTDTRALVGIQDRLFLFERI